MVGVYPPPNLHHARIVSLVRQQADHLEGPGQSITDARRPEGLVAAVEASLSLGLGGGLYELSGFQVDVGLACCENELAVGGQLDSVGEPGNVAVDA